MTPAQTQSWILDAVCETFGVMRDQLASTDRTPPLPDARAIACYLLHEHGETFPAIARQLGWLSHTTGVDAARRVKGSDELMQFVNAIKAEKPAKPPRTESVFRTRLRETLAAQRNAVLDEAIAVCEQQAAGRHKHARGPYQDCIDAIRRLSVAETLHRATAQQRVDRENQPATVQGE